MQDETPQDITGDNLESQVVPSDFSDETFARRLRLVREAAGMTQQQLADAMAATGNRFHRSTMGKIESGGRPVTIGEAVQLAGILGIRLEVLAADLPGDPWGQLAYRHRVEALVRLRSLQHEAAERHRLMEDARLLYEDTLLRIEQAQQRLAAMGGQPGPGTPGGKDDQ